MNERSNFKRGRVSWILNGLVFLSALNSAFFFLAVMKTGIVGWLMMNVCAPSIFILLVGFILRNPVVMTIGTCWMVRYGTAGLFVFGWTGPNLIAQVGHVLMTLASAWTVFEMVRQKKWRGMAVGAALGIATLLPFMMLQNSWFADHPGLLEKLFSGVYPTGLK